MSEQRKINEKINEYGVFCDSIGVASAADINKIIENKKASELISACEKRHQKQIDDIYSAITGNDIDEKVICISGPSSSGKTTFANKLFMKLKQNGMDAILISLDDYYKPFDKIPLNDEGSPDLEALEAIDYDTLNDHISQLVHGKTIFLPVYDFMTRKKIENGKQVCLKPNNVIIVEGIHALNPHIAESVSEKEKFKIYCSALNALKDVNHERIHSEDTRMIRRLVRDYYFRNASYSYTFELWDKVEAGCVKNVYPFTESADFIFNSALLYEYSVYKKHLDKIFKDVKDDDPDIEKIELLRSITGQFADLDDSFVPESSIAKEFIG